MKAIRFLLIVFLLHSVEKTWAAKRVDAHMRARETINERHRRAHFYHVRDNTPLDTTTLFKLTPGESLQTDFETNDVAGSKVVRLHETYKGLRVYDTVVSLRKMKDGRLLGDASGTLVQDIEEDLPDIQATLTDEDALRIATNNEGDVLDSVDEAKYSREVYLDNDNRARLVDVLSYVIGGVKRPFYIIDMKSGEILKNWQGLTTYPCCQRMYKAWGGNWKMGKITYGDMPHCLTPTIINGTCYLENQYARVIDNKHTFNNSLNETASFICEKGYVDEINGAYSPAVDAFFYGTVVGKMFEEWFQGTPLKNKAVLKVHYGNMEPGAYWTGKAALFGDGNNDMYFPLTLPDIVGHEIGHGVTEESSDLIYGGESGAVNEAFSDILGEATEDYLLQSDFVSGQYGMKYLPYKREFQTPENDNQSISHVDDMYDGIDVHHSSGIYRRVWYILTKEEGMSIRDVTTIFLYANKVYWHRTASFFECSCGLLRAAIDLGFDSYPFRKAFSEVGIEYCDVNQHVISLSNNQTKPEVMVSATINPVFRIEIPEYADTFIADVIAVNTSIKITITTCGWEKTDIESKKAKVVAEGKDSLIIPNATKRTFYIKLSKPTTEEDVLGLSVIEPPEEVHVVDLTAGFTCFPDYERSWEYARDCMFI